MVPLLRASAMSFVWPTTVSRHFGLLAFASMTVFAVEWSIIRRDGSILSHSTSYEASSVWHFEHCSFGLENCPVAWEFFYCSALHVLIVPAVLFLGIFLFFAATGGAYCYCDSRFQHIIVHSVDISPDVFSLYAWACLLLYYGLMCCGSSHVLPPVLLVSGIRGCLPLRDVVSPSMYFRWVLQWFALFWRSLHIARLCPIILYCGCYLRDGL